MIVAMSNAVSDLVVITSAPSDGWGAEAIRMFLLIVSSWTILQLVRAGEISFEDDERMEARSPGFRLSTLGEMPSCCFPGRRAARSATLWWCWPAEVGSPCKQAF